MSRVIFLVGSDRHRTAFDDAAKSLVRFSDNTVISSCWAFQKDLMRPGDRDAIHANNRRKMALCDVLLVIEPDGYIGKGTKEIIAEAETHGKTVLYWSKIQHENPEANHHCHADDCDEQVPPKMFMCKKHWFMLSRATRNLVWKHYVPGQEERKDPTPEYLRVSMAAIKEVADKEELAARKAERESPGGVL